jgi:hypothetical protein
VTADLDTLELGMARVNPHPVIFCSGARRENADGSMAPRVEHL